MHVRAHAGSPYSHATSPRMNTLRLQNAELLRKQHELEEQVELQQQQQQQLIERLVQRGLLQSQDEETNSLLQETQSRCLSVNHVVWQLERVMNASFCVAPLPFCSCAS